MQALTSTNIIIQFHRLSLLRFWNLYSLCSRTQLAGESFLDTEVIEIRSAKFLLPHLGLCIVIWPYYYIGDLCVLLYQFLIVDFSKFIKCMNNYN